MQARVELADNMEEPNSIDETVRVDSRYDMNSESEAHNPSVPEDPLINSELTPLIITL